MQTVRLNHTVPEACERLGVSKSTLYRLVNAGDLAVVKIGDRTLFPETELQAFQAKLISARQALHPARQVA